MSGAAGSRTVSVVPDLTWLVRLTRRHPLGTDVVLAAGIAATALLTEFLMNGDLAHDDPSFHAPSTLAIVLAVLAVALPQAWRRRFPLPAAVATCAGLIVGRWLLDVVEPVVTVLGCYLAIYSAARWGRRPWRTPALVVAVALVMVEV